MLKDIARNGMCQTIIKNCKKILQKGDKVLDFGCASGHFYLSLSDKDISYYGFDATKPYVNLQKNFQK